MTTFYVAGSSRGHDHIERARRCMRDLEALGWTNAYDWTPHIGAPKTDWHTLSACDLHAARTADVFVLLAEPETPGGMCELGARLAAPARLAHVVLDDVDHLFFRSINVQRHGAWGDFLEWIGKMAVGQKLRGEPCWLENAHGKAGADQAAAKAGAREKPPCAPDDCPNCS